MLGARSTTWVASWLSSAKMTSPSVTKSRETRYLISVSRNIREQRLPSWCQEIADNGHGAKLPENPPNTVL
jgi:hypothetical protein